MMRMFQNFMKGVPVMASFRILMPMSNSVDTAMAMKIRYRSSMTDKRMTQV